MALDTHKNVAGLNQFIESYLNQYLNKVPMWEIFVNLNCLIQTPVYSEQKS
jgi:hypothetical protein